jgi:hypothetical protein
MSPAKRHFASAAAVVGLALLGYWFLLAQPGSVATAHSDLVVFHLGLKQVLYDSLHSGRGLPFWRADQLGGAPAFTDPQAQFLLPLHFLFWLLPPAAALAPTIWLQLVVFGLAAYTLGGALRLGPWPRLFMAAAALFSSKVILAAYAGWLAYLSTIALLPLLFAVVIEMLDRARLTLCFWAAVTGALCLMSGMAQLLYYALFALAALVVVARPGRRSLSLLALGAFLAAGLVAHQLLPFVSEVHLYSRGRLDYPVFLSSHGRARQLLTLFWPDALGTPLKDPSVELWEDSAHFGFAALGLALLGIAQCGKRRWALAFTALFAVALLLSFDSPLLHFLFAYLPGMDRFRIPSRILFLAALFGLCLAGIGLERLLSRFDSRRAAMLGAAAVLAASLEGALQARSYFAGSEPQALTPSAAFRLDSGSYRTASFLRSTVAPGWAQGLGLQLVTGYNPLTFAHYQRYFDLLQTGQGSPPRYRGNWTDLERIARPDLLDALSVRYVVAPLSLHLKAAPVSTSLAQPVFVFYAGMRKRDLGLYRNPSEQPRARWVDTVVAVSGDDEAAAAVRSVNLRTTAVAVAEASRDPPPSALETVHLDGWVPGALAVSTSSERERFLLVSEVWHPGWAATIDGAAAPLLRADLALMGLRVPAGAHHVALLFRPLHWRVALAISAASATLLLGLAALAWRRR